MDKVAYYKEQIYKEAMNMNYVARNISTLGDVVDMGQMYYFKVQKPKKEKKKKFPH